VVFVFFAHDLRVPLSIIVAAVAELRRDMAFDAETRRMVDFVDDNAGRALRLCSDLIDMAALHSGLFRVNPIDADVVALARRAFDAFRMSHGPEPRMIFTAPTVSVPARVDPQRLTQMLGNLLTNAARHARACVRLTVSATAQDAVLIVEDDGGGVEVLEEGTLRARASATRPRSGLGLGLPIVRSIVQAHGGTLHVLNGAPDDGSGFCGARFVIKLPLPA
jgi:signal transduction histidine kinase